MTRERSVLFVIDVEPDARKTRPGPGGWEGTREALPLLARLRARLEDATARSVRFNWFLRLDPQIAETWGRATSIADACPDLLRTIAAHGDACGIHPHLWRWDAARADWFNDFGDRSWTAECVETSVAAFQALFGRRPDTCRFGDRWLDRDAIELMRRSRIHYDLTLEPGIPAEPVRDDRRARAWLPDYRRAPRVPYRPSDDDLLVPRADEPTEDDLWMLPVTTTPTMWRLMRCPPYVRRASRSPNLSLRASYVWPHIARELASDDPSPLVLVFRTGDVACPRFRRAFLATSERLAQAPALARCRFTDPASALAAWRAGDRGTNVRA